MPVSETSPHDRFEFREEYIDLTSLKMTAIVGNRLSEHRAWEQASPIVYGVISRLGEEGWEPVEPKIGFDLLVLGRCTTWSFVRGITAAFAGRDYSELDMQILGARLHFRRKVLAHPQSIHIAGNPGMKRFSSEARDSLEKMGYLIYALQGKSLRELHDESGEPIVDGTQLQAFVAGQWVQLDAPGAFWDEASSATEVAIDPHRLVLPESNDKSWRYHQKMVEAYSGEISRDIARVEAVIGEAANYVELALIHRRMTGMRLFKSDGGFYFTATKTVFELRSECLVQVGEREEGLRCWEYPLHTQGSYQVWIVPLIVPK